MKRLAFPLADPSARTLVAAAIFAAFGFAAPMLAVAADPMGTPAVAASASPAKMDKDSADKVAAQIKHLHVALQITPAQEPLWKDVADVMEDNAERVTAVAKERSEHSKTMTAVDDLKAYAAFTEAHEKGIEKLLPVFTKLYDNMSDLQKKAADEEFRHRHDQHEHGMHHGKG
jgi:protein CpxP